MCGGVHPRRPGGRLLSDLLVGCVYLGRNMLSAASKVRRMISKVPFYAMSATYTGAAFSLVVPISLGMHAACRSAEVRTKSPSCKRHPFLDACPLACLAASIQGCSWPE